MFLFLSYKIDSETPMYGGKNGIKSIPLSSIEEGNSTNTSKWEFPNHLGTHVDFPYHFYQNGQTINDFPADSWIIEGNKIQIIEINLSGNNLLIKPEDIKKQDFNHNSEFLILKTGFGIHRNQKKYWEYNPGLSIELTDWIRHNFKKIRFLGFDSISVSSWQHRDIGRKAHKKMLDPKKPILLIEDMDLTQISRNTLIKMIYIAPLIVKNTNGSPCTILAEVEN